MTLQALAAAASTEDDEIDPGNLSRFERGEQGIDLKKLEAIAGALHMTMSDLYRRAEAGPSIRQGQQGEYNVSAGPEVFGSLPLISYVQAGMWGNIVDPYEPGVAEKWIPVTRRYSKRAYCLRVRGDSMSAPEGPSFPDGSIICVEPELPAENKKFVICRLEDTAEATFKQLIIDGHMQYLKPLNPRYPILPIDRPATFCGVVRQMVLDVG